MEMVNKITNKNSNELGVEYTRHAGMHGRKGECFCNARTNICSTCSYTVSGNKGKSFFFLFQTTTTTEQENKQRNNENDGKKTTLSRNI